MVGLCAGEEPGADAGAALLQPQRWEQSLTDIHHPLPANSLIPMFEGMVDRALSRTSVSAPSTGNPAEANSAPADEVIRIAGFDFAISPRTTSKT